MMDVHAQESVDSDLDAFSGEESNLEPHPSRKGEANTPKPGDLPPSSGLSIDRGAGGNALDLIFRPPLWRVLGARFNRRAFDKGLGLGVLMIVGLGVAQLGPAMDMGPQERLMFAVMGLACVLPALGGLLSALKHLARWTAPRRLEIDGDRFWLKAGRTRWGGIRGARDDLRVSFDAASGEVVLSLREAMVTLEPVDEAEIAVIRHHLVEGLGVREVDAPS